MSRAVPNLSQTQSADKVDRRGVLGARRAAPDDGTPLPPPKRLLDLPPSEPLDFTIDGIVIAHDVNALVGDGDAGKSTVMIGGAGAVAVGMRAYGDRAVHPSPVLYVSGEDDAHVIRNRLEALAAGHGWNVGKVLGNVHVYDDGVDLDDSRWQARLIEAARDLKVGLACFDPVSDLCGDQVEENSNTDARRIVQYLRRFARQTGATPWLAMHVSKPADGRVERKHRVRGASAWRNATRMCWWVEAHAGGIELDPVKANRLGRPQALYLKRTVTTDPDRPLMWKAAHLGLDVAGDVVGADVIAILRHVAGCAVPPSSAEVETAQAQHRVPRDRVRAALGTNHTKAWLQYANGPRRAHLWSLTDAGRARLTLE